MREKIVENFAKFVKTNRSATYDLLIMAECIAREVSARQTVDPEKAQILLKVIAMMQGEV